MPFVKVKLSILGKAECARLCCRPYLGHKRGCPNFNKKNGCPPGQELRIDKDGPAFAVYNVFDFGAHVAKMREKHPEKSKRFHECCLYWQGTARKELRLQLARRLWEPDLPGLIIEETPEAAGINVTATMESAGIKLEWPPVTVTYQIVILGRPLPGITCTDRTTQLEMF